MAETLGDAILHLRTDSSKLDAGLADAQDKTESAAAQMQARAQRMGEIGQKLSMAVTLPLAAFGVAAGKAASDAEELQSAFDQTFGTMAGDMNEWAQTTGDAMGRSTQELQRAANMFGIFFNQAAPTKQAAADLSKEFTVLAQDLASFYNVDPGTAMEKLRAGLSGEAEPLRDFGVFLNEAAVGAKAMEMGLAASNKELTEQDKIMARAALIMESTKNAQGDVGRTSGSTANQVRAAKAAFEELQVTVGTKLLPVVTPLISGVATVLNWFSQLPAPVQTGVVAIAALAAVLGPALIGISAIASGMGSVIVAARGFGAAVDVLGLLKNVIPIIGMVGKALLTLAMNPVFLTIAALVAGVYLAWSNWDKIKPIIDGVGAAVSNWWNANVQPILTAVGNKVKELVAIWEQYFGTQLKNVVTMVRALMNVDFKAAWEAMKSIVSTALNAVGRMISAFAPNLARVMAALVQRMVASGREIIAGLASGIREAGEAVWNALKSVVLAGINRIRDFLGIRSPSLLFKEMGGDIADGLAIGIEEGIPTVQAAMGQLAQAVADAAPAWSVDVGGGPMKLPEAPMGSEPAGAPTDENGEQWKEGFRSWFKDGVRAAMDGDLGGFMKDWLSGIADRMFDRALDGLADMLANALGGLFGGGAAGGGGEAAGIANALGTLFSGFFATGGTIPAGTFGIVGEKGPEPVISTPRGALVRPNSSLGSFAASMRPNTPSVQMPVTINAPGADAAALERVRQSLDQLRAEVPSIALGTIQDAGDRRMISTGGWR